jgi:site-specific recombinase XerD
MALRLYRRHRNECEAGFAKDFKSGEFEESRRGWKHCSCLITAAGTIAGKFNRQSTGEWRWEEAKAVIARWETAGTWKLAEPSKPIPPESSTVSTLTTVQDAIDGFLAKCHNRNIAPNTLSKYKTFTNQLAAYCQHRGYLHIGQLTVSDMDRFYASWKDGVRAKAKKLERLKAFVKFCLKRDWIGKDITEDLQAPEGSSVTVPKSPFTDEELKRIYEACDTIGPPTKEGPGYRTWSGNDARDFIDLSIYTGLRISDVATFDITKRLKGNDVFLRMHKTKRPLFTWIPDWLVERLHARVPANGSLIFGCGVTRNAKQLCDIWRNKRLRRVFELSGPWIEKPTPHKFRHTFVRILLERGVPVADVAELIGDTEQVLRKSYAAWIPGRQDRLSRILQEAFADRPRGKIVAIR